MNKNKCFLSKLISTIINLIHSFTATSFLMCNELSNDHVTINENTLYILFSKIVSLSNMLTDLEYAFMRDEKTTGITPKIFPIGPYQIQC